MTKLAIDPSGKCFYQTPAMRATAPDSFQPGELLPDPNNPRNMATVVLKKLNGKYLTPCLNGDPTVDGETDTPLDQELFTTVEGNPCVLAIDRTRFTDDQGIGRAYVLAIMRRPA